jgi:hypothetical protein
MVIIEGRSDVLDELMESPEFRKLNNKAVMVDDFQAKLHYGGTDAELQQSTAVVAPGRQGTRLPVTNSSNAPDRLSASQSGRQPALGCS